MSDPLKGVQTPKTVYLQSDPASPAESLELLEAFVGINSGADRQRALRALKAFSASLKSP